MVRLIEKNNRVIVWFRETVVWYLDPNYNSKFCCDTKSLGNTQKLPTDMDAFYNFGFLVWFRKTTYFFTSKPGLSIPVNQNASKRKKGRRYRLFTSMLFFRCQRSHFRLSTTLTSTTWRSFGRFGESGSIAPHPRKQAQI